MTGHVSVVGAGPGDPGLLTRHAIARLRRADLVLYDALVDERVLRYARKAQRFFVGKRAGRHALSQPAIEALMIRAARRGRRVVRLKGGDPFVFGRGGEEVRSLQRAGVPYDVVPGVTNAVAAPAAAGIPVTHRGLASGFVVVSGHDELAFVSAIGALTPNALTLVVLMGMTRSAALAGRLIDLGWPRRTPAAIVVDAWTADQHAWRGTLDELAADAVDVDRAGAGTIVIGAVAALGIKSALSTPLTLSRSKAPLILSPSKDELALRQAQGERSQMALRQAQGERSQMALRQARDERSQLALRQARDERSQVSGMRKGTPCQS